MDTELVSGLLGLSIILAIPFLVLAAGSLDVRTKRGYALGCCSLLLLVCPVTALVGDLAGGAALGNIGLLVAQLLGYVVVLIAMLCLSAIFVATRSGQPSWAVGFLVAALVPLVVAVVPLPLADNPWMLFVASLALPEVVVLAFSIIRIARPVVPAPARQPITPR